MDGPQPAITLFFMAGGLLSFGAKTQTLAAQSTIEAEIQALSYAAREAVYISNFMGELHFKGFESVPIHSDSTGALAVAGNAMHSQKRPYSISRKTYDEYSVCNMLI